MVLGTKRRYIDAKETILFLVSVVPQVTRENYGMDKIALETFQKQKQVQRIPPVHDDPRRCKTN
jgi:hypothetical protein